MDDQALMAIINRAMDSFHGDSSQLESAIGAVIVRPARGLEGTDADPQPVYSQELQQNPRRA